MAEQKFKMSMSHLIYSYGVINMTINIQVGTLNKDKPVWLNIFVSLGLIRPI